MWKFPELASSFVGALSPIGTMGKQFVLSGAIVCTALTSFQAGCKGQHVGDIMSQLVPRGSQGDMCWSCALPVLTGGRTDLLGSWNVLGPFLSGLSKQSTPAGLPPAARPPDLQASGSHCPPMLRPLRCKILSSLCWDLLCCQTLSTKCLVEIFAKTQILVSSYLAWKSVKLVLYRPW